MIEKDGAGTQDETEENHAENNIPTQCKVKLFQKLKNDLHNCHTPNYLKLLLCKFQSSYNITPLIINKRQENFDLSEITWHYVTPENKTSIQEVQTLGQ